MPIPESLRIGPDDPRYLAGVDKRFNKRFIASPDYVRLVSSTDQMMSAVEEAVREERRLVVTSGGHCLEGFVSDPDVRVIVDTSDTDLAYPALNTSGVSWPTLYYKTNYPRLQRIKARWDPRNVFHDALSIRAGNDDRDRNHSSAAISERPGGIPAKVSS